MKNRKGVKVIAELGVNHNGSVEIARQMIDEAARAGVDYVKFQTFQADSLVSKDAPQADYQKRSLSKTHSGETQYEMIRRLELSREVHRELYRYAETQKVGFLSTPFDLPSLEFLVKELGLSLIKLSSGEVTNAPLLYAAARSGVSVILSTGASELKEVYQALGVLACGYLGEEAPAFSRFEAILEDPQRGQEVGRILKEKVSLLHCLSEYPAPLSEVNLRAMESLKTRWDLTVGYSDHTLGLSVPIAAVALGAQIIEKHFTLDRKMEGPDHPASLEPQELRDLVRSIREVETALGDGIKKPAPSEEKNRMIIRRSLFANSPIKAGEVFTEQNLTFKRPGAGVSPMRYWERLGQKAQKNYQPDEMIES